MKKLLLATAVSALTINAVQAAPTVYGKLHVGVGNKETFVTKGGITNGDTTSSTAVDSFESRFGVKGEEILTDNLKAIYQIEWALNADGDGTVTGGATDLTQRNRYLGLKYEGIGSVKAGRLDTHLKTAQGKVDIFNDMYTDMKFILTGENRINNVLSFESDPKALEGVGVNVMLIQAENNKLATNSEDSNKKRLGSAVSASVVYDNKDMGVYAALAGDQNVPNTFTATGKNAETQAFRLVGVLDMETIANVPGLTLGALFQTAKPDNLSPAATKTGGDFFGANNIDSEDSFLISGGYNIAETPYTIKAQYGRSTTSFNTAGISDIEQQVLGGLVEYKLNSKTRAYGYVSQLTSDKKLSNKSETPDRTFAGVGMEFNF